MKRRKKENINFFYEMSQIAQEMKKNTFTIILDYYLCKLKYKANIEDYLIFEMYKLNKYERKTIITQGINNSYILKYNDPKYIHSFENKAKFNKTFSKYINRTWLELKETNKNEFAIFCIDHKEVITKPVNNQNGSKINKLKVADYKLKELYEELIQNNQTLIEEVVKQCDKLSKLHPNSINTIRVITLLGNIIAAYIKIGNKNNVVDSFEREGLIATIDLKTGKVNNPAINKMKEIFENHPITNEKILNFQIPYWKKLKKVCEEVALEIPQVGYVAWDFYLNDEECYLMEGDAFPDNLIYGYTTYQKNVGLLPIFKKAEEREIEE